MRFKSDESTSNFEAMTLNHAIVNRDALNLLSDIEGESFAMTTTSPPCIIGKTSGTNSSIKSLMRTQENMIIELIRILSGGGSICWEVGNDVDRGEMFPWDNFATQIFKQHFNIRALFEIHSSAFDTYTTREFG